MSKYPWTSTFLIATICRQGTSGCACHKSVVKPRAASPMISIQRITAAWATSSLEKVRRPRAACASIRLIASRMSRDAPGRFSNRDRLVKHTPSDPRLQTLFSDDINGMTKKVLKVHDECGQIEQTPSWLEIDEKIDVTGDVRIAARHRPKHANIRGTVTSSHRQDLGTQTRELRQRRAGSPATTRLGDVNAPLTAQVN
jgi:hypothetical protein